MTGDTLTYFEIEINHSNVITIRSGYIRTSSCYTNIKNQNPLYICRLMSDRGFKGGLDKNVKEFFPNDKEIDYASEHGLQDKLDLSMIPLIKRISYKNRDKLDSESISYFVNEINGFVEKYPESHIFSFYQFNKSDVKSKREMDIISNIQLASNLKTYTFQELDSKDNLESYKERVDEANLLADDREIYAILEIESKSVEEKVDYAILSGVRNFIIRGGKYNDVEKWLEIRETIRKAKGTFAVSLPRRMDRNRISYFRYALSYGCNFTFHEKPVPFPVDVTSILNLTNDLKYAEIDVNGEYGITLSDDNSYSFSRARTILKAMELAPTISVI